MTEEPDLAPYQIIIYDDPFDDPEEAARIDITGQVTGEQSYVEEFQNRLNDERDPFIGEMTDGRELLRYVRASYTTGYIIATYNSERTQEIVEELSDAEYEEWKSTTDIDTSLSD
jgi:hypothetical protein